MGQLSNRAAVEFTQEGFGKMSCLAGIGGQLSGFVQSVSDVADLLVIDECQVGCAKAIMEQIQIPIKNYMVLTDMGIEKNKEFDLKPEDVTAVKDAAR